MKNTVQSGLKLLIAFRESIIIIIVEHKMPLRIDFMVLLSDWQQGLTQLETWDVLLGNNWSISRL